MNAKTDNSIWTCPCGYENAQNICTHCGKLRTVTTTLPELIDSPRGIAAMSFAVSLSSGKPFDILSGSGISWDTPDGITIRYHSDESIGDCKLADFEKLQLLATQLREYCDTLQIIADRGMREFADDE